LGIFGSPIWVNYFTQTVHSSPKALQKLWRSKGSWCSSIWTT
jgi:hypothetical protein